MPPLSVTLTGADALMARLQTLGREGPRVLAGALHRAHEVIMTEAKRRTPVQFGALKASGHVALPRIEATQIVSEGGFGGAAVDYAVFVHENVTARHTVGQAKFYESALLEASRTLAADLARDVAAALTRMGR